MQIFLFFVPQLDRFEINLKISDGPKADIAFHFNPRFDEKVVVRNTFRKGAWGREERQETHFPFTPGVNFDIIIRCENQVLKVGIKDPNSHSQDPGPAFISCNILLPKPIRCHKILSLCFHPYIRSVGTPDMLYIQGSLQKLFLLPFKNNCCKAKKIVLFLIAMHTLSKGPTYQHFYWLFA